MERIKVLILFHFTAMGGAEQLVFDLAKHLKKTKFQPVGCCLVPLYKASLYNSKYNKKQIENTNAIANKIFHDIGVSFFNVRIKSIYHLNAIKELYRLIKYEKIKIIFCLDSQPERTIGLLTGALSLSSHLILSAHYDPFDDKLTHYLSFLDKFFLRFAAKVTATSEYQKQRLVTQENLSASKIQVIHNGVDLSRFNGNHTILTKKDFDINSEDKVVGIVGRLVPCKGHSVFLKAAQSILAQHAATYFFIVGDGVERSNLEALSNELNIANNIRFLGLRNDIPKVLPVFDVAVMASHSENLPISILEYMAVGKPIVSTNVGGISELLTDGTSGLLVEPNNPEQLSNAISRLLSDTSYAQKLARSARERVASRFSIEAMIRNLEDLFDSLSLPDHRAA